MPFDHPLWVLYSSGTTGLPKAIVHGHGGILRRAAQEGPLHLDVHPGDRMFWFTTTGWMMWNFLVGTLLGSSTIVLYDGNPAHPGLEALWDYAEQARMTCFGTSASYIASCQKAGFEPRATATWARCAASARPARRSRPRASTGSTSAVSDDVWLFSTSGGTDVCTAFVGGVPDAARSTAASSRRARWAARCEAWDEHGRPVVDRVGELVITEPMPSMPLFFWNDPDDERYRASYFDELPGRVAPRRLDRDHLARHRAIISGRSDSTINRQGVRMGTSEIYRAVLAAARRSSTRW